jgi:putative DNA primase/helicase
MSDLINVPAAAGLARAAESVGGISYTPQGVALQLAATVGGSLRFVSEDRQWIAFDGKRWDVANALTIAEMLWDNTFLPDRIRALDSLSGKARESELQSLATLMSARARNEAFELAKPKLAVSRAQFDRDAAHLLVTPGGTYDLRTGSVAANSPERYLTRCTSVAPDSAVPCPRFCELVARLSGDDAETEHWLWLALGYTLTGDVREDAVFYLRGPGSNGKSTLIKTFFALMGDYATKLDIRVLASGSEFHATELAHVRGARFVVSSEIEKGMRLRESVLKDLSGGEVQTPREIQQKAKDAARWNPECKLWLYGNHDLQVRGGGSVRTEDRAHGRVPRLVRA